MRTKKAKLTAIAYTFSIFTTQKQFSSIYITYTLLIQAQEALNEDALVDEQPPEIGDDLNDSDVENQAPINHIVDYMEDYMMDKNKEFDEKLLDESFTSLKEAYRTLALKSTKKHNGNVLRQFRKF